MPLGEPPDPHVLTGLAKAVLIGRGLHRVYRADRRSPWWFASVPDAPDQGGRFDLPAPDGACYLATSPAGAALEAFQDFGRGLLPVSELRSRRRAEVSVPSGTPPAGQLTSARSRSVGVTPALWSIPDRPLTQRWARALRRAGWAALWHGTGHDPTGQTRAVTLFDVTGEHPPYGDAEGWTFTAVPLDADPDTMTALDRYGIRVTPDPDPAVVDLDHSGLL